MLSVSNLTHEAHEKTDIKCSFCHNRVGHETEDHENHMNMTWCFEECHAGEAFIKDCNVCHTESFTDSLSEEKIADIEEKTEKEIKKEAEEGESFH